ncbi:hypothetical protein B0H16DRAFT_1478131 [Mycena metata]|uniref:Uncharacterized protein n=1 Tax=Mycena metata TaxID=1033252 RepID=A0AAD7H838_9AGAR|nr:hypothetical protein B0H16DRAFT_1478131 [Mycena metata]
MHLQNADRRASEIIGEEKMKKLGNRADGNPRDADQVYTWLRFPRFVSTYDFLSFHGVQGESASDNSRSFNNTMPQSSNNIYRAIDAIEESWKGRIASTNSSRDAIHICALVAPCIYTRMPMIKSHFKNIHRVDSYNNNWALLLLWFFIAATPICLLMMCYGRQMDVSDNDCDGPSPHVSFVGGGLSVNGKYLAKTIVPCVVNDNGIDNLEEGTYAFEFQCELHAVAEHLAKNDHFVAINLELDKLVWGFTKRETIHTSSMHKVP